MAYTETISRNGEVITAAVSDASALTTLRAGQRHGATVEVAKDGTVTITRVALRFGARDGEVVESTTVNTLAPTAKQARLTKTQYEDLERIRTSGTYSTPTLREDGSIRATFWRIPPSVSRRLLDRGLVVAVGTTIKLGIAGLVAMAAYEHQAWTVGGSSEVSDNGRSAGWHWFASAHCTCKQLHLTETTREPARRAVNQHMSAVLTAALIGA